MATTLLILRGTGLLHTHGRSVAAATSLAVLIYAGHNLLAAIVAYAGGHWIDRTGPRIAFATGAAVYVTSYLLFALTSSGDWPLLVIAFLFAGTGHRARRDGRVGARRAAAARSPARERLRAARRRAVIRRLRILGSRRPGVECGLPDRRLSLCDRMDGDRHRRRHRDEGDHRLMARRTTCPTTRLG